MADLPTITKPTTSREILAQTGKITTVSFGMNTSNVSPLENSPPIPAVISINATDIMPKHE
tara:strand:+ start:1313 stop:1495 length:183 start_codon:yes stop_codon:yes gene_type:complete